MSPAARPTAFGRLACAGDSIAFGTGLPNRENESCPAILATKLGNDWPVENFGVEGIRALDNGPSSAFRHLPEYAPISPSFCSAAATSNSMGIRASRVENSASSGRHAHAGQVCSGIPANTGASRRRRSGF